MKLSIRPSRRIGFTLIELLVTITVLAILAVIVIPTVRVLSRERKVRDTARIVGSVFASARDQAAIDGMAGVRIEANPNIPNMGTRLYRLRSLPPFAGITTFDTATVTGNVADLLNPIPDYANVKVGDYIEFNYSGVLFRITGPDPDPDPDIQGPILGPAIEFDNSSPSDPIPPQGTALPYRIHRQPIKVQSSVVELPNRLFINFALSGHGIDGTQFNGSTNLEVWFERSGAVDRIKQDFAAQPVFPAGSIYLLLCTADGGDIDMTNLDGDVNLTNTRGIMANADNLWVVIEHRSGSVSIGKMANAASVQPSPPGAGLPQQIRDIRSQAQNRRSANP